MTAPLPPPLKYVTHSQQNSPAKRRHLEAYAKAAVREALERAARNAELVQLRMKLPDQPHACIYAENLAVTIRAMIVEYK